MLEEEDLINYDKLLSGNISEVVIQKSDEWNKNKRNNFYQLLKLNEGL